MMSAVLRGTLFILLAVSALGAQQPSDAVKNEITARVSELYGFDAPALVQFYETSRGGAQWSVPGLNRKIEATGIVVLERDNELYLDAVPCETMVVTFVKPYKKTEAGTQTCGGTIHKTYRIVKE